MLKTERFSRCHIAEKRGIDVEAVSEQDVKDCAAELNAVRDTIEWFESEAFDKWVERDIHVRELLRLITSDYLEYDMDPEEDPDCGICAGYFRHLQAKYGPTGFLSIHEGWDNWTSLRYTVVDCDDHKDYVIQFRAAKAKVDQALVNPIETRLELFQFLSVISVRVECVSLVTSPLRLSPAFCKERDSEDMKRVYHRFIGRRLSSHALKHG